MSRHRPFARAGVGQAVAGTREGGRVVRVAAQFATVNLLADEQKLVLLPEQLVSNDDGPGALRRRFTSMDALVYYAPANVTDIVAPRILSTGATSSAAGTTFKVETTDTESGVARVVILYRKGNNYLPLDLKHTEGTNEWVGAVAGVSNPHFIAQSVDAAGNIGTTSNKAVLHEANGQGAEFGITFDGPVGDNDWFTAHPRRDPDRRPRSGDRRCDRQRWSVGPVLAVRVAHGRRHLRRRRVDRIDDLRGHREGRPHRADDHHEPGDHDLDGVPGRSGGDARGQLRRSRCTEQFRVGEL